MKFSRFLVVLFWMFLSLILRAQISNIQTFQGEWYGELYIYKNTQLIDSADVNFSIQPISDSVLTWKLRYNSKNYKNVLKDYQLRYNKDNHFTIYENDSISLDAYWYDGILYSNFTYGENLISAQYNFRTEDRIEYTIEMGKEHKVTDKIKSYQTNTLQKILFRRVKN